MKDDPGRTLLLLQASDSKHHFTFWSTLTSVEEFDLVFIEFNIGDTFQDGLPHALESKGPAGDTVGESHCSMQFQQLPTNNGILSHVCHHNWFHSVEYQSGWYFEVMLRRLLLLRKPDPVAIITFNADYVGRVWAKPPYYG